MAVSEADERRRTTERQRMENQSCPRNQKQKDRPLGWFFLFLNCAAIAEAPKKNKIPQINHL